MSLITAKALTHWSLEHQATQARNDNGPFRHDKATVRVSTYVKLHELETLI